MQNISRRRAGEVKAVLVNRMFSQAPGVYTLLKGLARKKAMTDPVELFLRNPKALYKLLMEHYNDRITAMFVFRNMFIKPLAEYLGLYGKEDELAKAAIAGCEELLRVIDSLNPQVKFDEIGLCVEEDSEVPSAASSKGGSGGRHVSYLIPSRMTASLIEEFE